MAGGGGGGWHRREMFFLVKYFSDPTIKKSKNVLPNLKYQLENKYPPLAKNFTKGYTHPVPLLWHEFDNCLWNFLQSKVSCCLHKYFLWRQHLPHDKSENDQDSNSDWFTYCIDIWHVDIAFSLQYLSESCFGTIHFYYPTLELFCFSFTQPFTHSKFCLPNHFLFGATPAINNDRSLNCLKNNLVKNGNLLGPAPLFYWVYLRDLI